MLQHHSTDSNTIQQVPTPFNRSQHRSTGPNTIQQVPTPFNRSQHNSTGPNTGQHAPTPENRSKDQSCSRSQHRSICPNTGQQVSTRLTGPNTSSSTSIFCFICFCFNNFIGTYCPKGVGHEGDSGSHARCPPANINNNLC